MQNNKYFDLDNSTQYDDPNLWKSFDESSGTSQLFPKPISPNTVGSSIENTDTGLTDLMDLDFHSILLPMPVDHSTLNHSENAQPTQSSSCLAPSTSTNKYHEKTLSSINICAIGLSGESDIPLVDPGSPANESNTVVRPTKVRRKHKRGVFLHMKNDPSDFRAIRAKKQKEIRDKQNEKLRYLEEIKEMYMEQQKSVVELEKSNSSKDDIIQQLRREVNEALEELAEVRQSESLLKEQILLIQTEKPKDRLSQQQKEEILKKTQAIYNFFSSPGDIVRLSSNLEQVVCGAAKEDNHTGEFSEFSLKTDVTIRLQIEDGGKTSKTNLGKAGEH